MFMFADAVGGAIAAASSETISVLDQVIALVVQSAPDVIKSLIILVGGVWLSGRAEAGIRKLLERQPGVDAMLRGVAARVARYIVLIVVLVAFLGQLGVETTSILAALGAIGLAVGLALQGTLANVAAGIMLLWLRPFRIGDYIEVEAQTGTVHEVGLFATTMITVEGLFVFVPNGEIWNKKLINYSRMPRRMVRELFTISYDDDIGAARNVLLSVVSNDPRVHTDPEPTIKVVELGDNAVVLEMRAWTDNDGFVQTKWDIIEQGKTSLEGAGITIPYPQRDIHLHSAQPDSNGLAVQPVVMGKN